MDNQLVMLARADITAELEGLLEGEPDTPGLAAALGHRHNARLRGGQQQIDHRYREERRDDRYPAIASRDCGCYINGLSNILIIRLIFSI